jgi:hypothetical protein
VPAGPEGLHGRTGARHQDSRRIPPESQRAILSIRRRLEAHAEPATRDCSIGAAAIRAKLKALRVGLIPGGRRIERVLQRYGLNGRVKNFNGWFQPRLFDRRDARLGDLRRELARLQKVVNTRHVNPRLGGRTPAHHRRRPRLLPASFVVPAERLPTTAGLLTFIRRVSTAGTVRVVSQSFRMGRTHRGLYLRLLTNTVDGWRTACLHG